MNYKKWFQRSASKVKNLKPPMALVLASEWAPPGAFFLCVRRLPLDNFTPGSTGIRTQDVRIKTSSANLYTIKPVCAIR